jgi:hypothetical protein
MELPGTRSSRRVFSAPRGSHSGRCPHLWKGPGVPLGTRSLAESGGSCPDDSVPLVVLLARDTLDVLQLG